MPGTSAALRRSVTTRFYGRSDSGDSLESEAKVREALDRLMAGRTCVMITHDIPSIADADLVLVLEDGRIIDRGTHAELVASSARYRQLYELNLQQPA